MPKTYHPAVDLIRTIAILGAVSIHIVQPIYSRPDFLDGITWWISDGWNAAARVSIPLFLMLSGYLLLSKSENYAATLRRTAFRLTIPLLFWFLCFRIWNGGFPTLTTLSPVSLVVAIWQSSVFHLYFLIILIGLYLLLPLARVMTHTWQLVPLCLLLGVVFTLLQYRWPNPWFTNATVFWFPYLGYFLAGHLLGRLRSNPIRRAVATIGLCGGAIATLLLSYQSIIWLTTHQSFLYPPGVLSPYFDHYLSPNVMLMSLSAFFLLIHVPTVYPFLIRSLRLLAANAFGIYLIHSFLIDFIDQRLNLGNDFVHFPLLPYLIIKFTTVLLGSLFLTNIGRHTPILKLAFGEK